MPTILIVDDYCGELSPLGLALSESFAVRVALSLEEATSVLSALDQPAIVLLGHRSTEANGLEAIPILMASSRGNTLPIVVLTDTSSDAAQVKALELGATDYLSKSVNPQVLKARLQTHVKNYENIQQAAANLMEEIGRKDKELLLVQDVAATAMASMAEIRDPDTVNHIRRTQNYVRTLARKLSTHPEYSGVLSLSFIATLFKAAPLHDIGKTGIPDRILLKPGRLTPEETEIMRTHTTIGRDIIEGAELASEATMPFFTVAKEIIYSHHEKWDGTGYPQGLLGNQIPVAARLMALADVYDALISKRTYKDPMSHESAVDVIQSSSGRHFDPNIVEAFMAVNASFKAIAIAHCDAAQDYQKKADYKSIVYPLFKD